MHVFHALHGLRLCRPKWDNFGLDWPPNGPKTAPNHCKRYPTALRQAAMVSGGPNHGWNPLGQRGGCLFIVSVCFSCVNGTCWPILGPVWSVCIPQFKTKNWPYLGLDGLNCGSKTTLSSYQPPLLVVSTPWSWSWSCLSSTYTYAHVYLHL